MAVQVDLASSLAVLMGVPIPFGNIGRVSRQLLDLADLSDPEQAYKQALLLNAQQVQSQLTSFLANLCNESVQAD